jgi:hypothetical protein
MVPCNGQAHQNCLSSNFGLHSNDSIRLGVTLANFDPITREEKKGYTFKLSVAASGSSDG